MPKYHFDCLKFRGYKPCTAKKLCETCDEFDPWEIKIAIIKLGALGDVLRTTPILHALRRKYPKAHITWITKRNAKDLLEASPRINRLLLVDEPDNGALLRLLVEEFDELHCYDKEDPATSLAALVKARRKYGFHMNTQGQIAPLNKEAEPSFDLGLSDDLKFNQNTKTYQEMMYESARLPMPKPMDPYDFTLSEKDRRKAERIAEFAGARGPVIGLNTGAGRAFRTKEWQEEYFLQLAKMLKTKLKARVLLLGGLDEDARNKRLALKLKGIAHYPGGSFSLREFAGIIEKCSLVVTGDTLAMHLALAVGTPPVVLFGSTCHQEIDFYGLGEKIVSRPACAPCYKSACDQLEWMKCMKDIPPSRVFEAVARLLRKARA